MTRAGRVVAHDAAPPPLVGGDVEVQRRQVERGPRRALNRVGWSRGRHVRIRQRDFWWRWRSGGRQRGEAGQERPQFGLDSSRPEQRQDGPEGVDALWREVCPVKGAEPVHRTLVMPGRWRNARIAVAARDAPDKVVTALRQPRHDHQVAHHDAVAEVGDLACVVLGLGRREPESSAMLRRPLRGHRQQFRGSRCRRSPHSGSQRRT